ncbi:MAG TPA: response regulator [Thermoanaerobaculia bacterium]|nr:response regulator [Thermoanaerobaculia bacterium]
MTTDPTKRVLIVDDEKDVRDILFTVLQQRGIQSDCAANGREALDLIGQHPYVVVVLDLMMPEVDGFAVLDRLRESGTMPVVLVLTAADQGLIDRLDASLIHGLIRKPFEPAEIADVIAACADIRSRSMFETMALAAMIASGPLVTFFSR